MSITSSQNPLIKHIRRLKRDKHARQESGLFVVEGIQGVVAAVGSGLPILAVVYAPEQLSSPLALQTIEHARQRGIRCEAVPAAVFATISERENPVGIAAVVQRRALRLDELQAAPDGLYVALFEVSDPGNAGTVVRTLDAAGGAALFLPGTTVDPFHPTAVKASAGAIFTVPIVSGMDIEALLHWCQREGVQVVSTSDRAPHTYWSIHYSNPLLLLMGSEAHGLPDDLLARLPLTVSIPMRGSADSLNVAVATALLLYEVLRQRYEQRG